MGGLMVDVKPTHHPDGRPMWEVAVRIGRMYLVVRSFFDEASARAYETNWLGQRKAWEDSTYG